MSNFFFLCTVFVLSLRLPLNDSICGKGLNVEVFDTSRKASIRRKGLKVDVFDTSRSILCLFTQFCQLDTSNDLVHVVGQ